MTVLASKIGEVLGLDYPAANSFVSAGRTEHTQGFTVTQNAAKVTVRWVWSSTARDPGLTATVAKLTAMKNTLSGKGYSARIDANRLEVS